MRRPINDAHNEWGDNLMTANVHPSSNELLVALQEPDRAASMLEHLDECLACRVRLSRIRQASGPGTPGADSLQRIIDASTPLPETLADVVSDRRAGEPQPNEIWRVGRDEALLVWVRRVFEDGVADVVPLVLDVELADQQSVVVDADATPLATEIAAMVSLRTHVHLGAFINRVGILDIGKDVVEVMTAVREGRRPSGVRVGAPINDDDDQRLEYRQALRDLLAELSPSAWSEEDAEADNDQKTSGQTVDRPSDQIDVIKTDLGERLSGVRCRDVQSHVFVVDATTQVRSVMKIEYLGTAVLVMTLHGGNPPLFPASEVLAAACRPMTLVEADVDAVAVSIPENRWLTQLFTAAHMRSAFELPGGSQGGPTATLDGHGLVDTLCKHLEGVVTPWEVTEPADSHIGLTSVHQLAVKHANASIERLAVEGKRARQVAKKAAWGDLPDGLANQVASFVVAVANREGVEDALADLGLEVRDD
jgi:hypothetical protein